MGILSLTSFVDENPKLLTDLKLHDTRVVIDGNNLYHFCYTYFSFSHQYGGDYDTYADKIRYYFSALKSCNIEPYVIFDGAYDADDKKLKTTVKRAKDRLHSACLLSSGRRAVICPILTFETFISVLDELHVNHMTCDFEADREIAALAKEWNCPVMSNDSDFFIYDLPSGFILFDYLSLVVRTQKDEDRNYRYLDAQVYYVDNLLKHAPGMDRSCMALFATLMGNDYVNPDDFASFFSHHKFPRAPSRRFKTSKRHERMICLLTWLESAGPIEKATKTFLSRITQKREKVEKLVKMSVDSYLNLTSRYSGYFTAEKSVDSMETELQSKCKHRLPGWCVAEARCSRLPVTALNTFVHRRNILLTQIEVMSEDSAYNCARSLRQIFTGILLSTDAEEPQTFDEYTRQVKQLKKNTLEATLMLPDGSKVPSLHAIPTMPQKDRTDFLMECLGSPNFEALTLDDCMVLAIHIIPYWIKNSIPKINILHLYALIICFVKVSILDKKGKSSQDGAKGSKGTCDSNAKTARENIEKLLQRESKHVFDVHCIHAYSQYQACLKACMYLNGLLLRPLPQSKPEQILNGTCFSSICCELKQRKCPKLYIEELLVRESELAVFFNQILNAVLEQVAETDLEYPEEGKKNAKKRARRSKKVEPTSKIVSESEDEDQSEEENNLKIAAACTLGNKFALLDIAD